MKNKLKNFIKKFRLGRELITPAGHFHSPINSKTELLKREANIWGSYSESLVGIDLNENRQLELLNSFKEFYRELPFTSQPRNGHRFYFENEMYSYGDSIFLYCVIRKFNPKRIIEVGSGFSSALMLDTNKLHYNNKIECTFIEPYPERLNSLLMEGERINLIQQFVQDVNIELFDQLEADDLLFIDSSHVAKTGSDLNFLIFEVLPRLKKGVKIHFHDIFYPFEYPKSWLLEDRRDWNENYFLRAFLSGNTEFKIIAFNTYMEEFQENWFKKNMPLCLKNKGGSIWLERVN
ncbi:MAG: class I SAM-dependent methyltransferase [Cyclobacteriaceae bacterium]